MNIQTEPLWRPDKHFMKQSAMHEYMQWLERELKVSLKDYASLREWSVSNISHFWESIAAFFRVRFDSPYASVMQLPPEGMIGTKWFEGARLNYAEHIFRNRSHETPAIIFGSESSSLVEISWEDLESRVARLAAWLREHGVISGDRVVSLMPNIPETVIAFLAANSIGAIWSSCSPDFGVESILDRFGQIEPKVIFLTDGYVYNGKSYDRKEAWKSLITAIPSVEQVVIFPILQDAPHMDEWILWNELMDRPSVNPVYTPVAFDHPIWVLYSSGTTGKPKAITHSVGGCLLEHLKALVLHQDVRPGERYFWYSTTGWMMWNYSVASMLAGATLLLYDGAAAHPQVDALWHFVRDAGCHHFGVGAAYHIASMKAGLHFEEGGFPSLRSIGSTGSPLPPEAFRWIYASVKKDVWLVSLSGGTDICSAFVGGCPLLPVTAGEIQCRMLGCDLEAFDENGQAVQGQLGEMVIKKPMPSMPLYFWNDPGNDRYRSSYFNHYPGIWRHGDWIEIRKNGSVIIFGRSDATLNRDGVRIGTSEIYAVIDGIPEVSDSLVVCIEQAGGKFFMPLFVVMKSGYALDEELKLRIRMSLRTKYSPRHVPDEIYAVPDIPYTISGKKMETPVKKILMGIDPEAAASRDTMRNPDALFFYVRFAPGK